ncbi:TonB-dependent receptor [Sphingobacterium sp.]|uniref:TonB-dependent receptor n=1 Tax=Sphingobacterium sp. TaxID=341027 RepID=UPI0028A267C0|nr:TonB-dependent receptor [Sphingobacterium sp.]
MKPQINFNFFNPIGIFFFLLIILSSHKAFCQTAAVRGTIKLQTGERMPFVTVLLSEGNKSVQTDNNGNYNFTALQAGNYTISAKYLGTNMESKQITLLNGQEMVLDFVLSVNERVLDGIEISGYRRFGKKESEQVAKLPLKNLENPQVYNVVPKEILQEQVIVTYNDVLKNVTGVSQGLVNGSNSFYMRGFENNSFIRNGIQDRKDNSLEVANIEHIEVLKGPSATLFGNSLTSFGGLINRVTKKPFDIAKGEISYTLGGFDLNRITADINTPLAKGAGLLMRTNIAYHDEGNYMDAGFTKRLFIAPSLLYKVNDRLTISIDAEIYQQKANDFHRLFPEMSFTKKSTESLGINWKRYYHGNDLTESKPSVSIYAEAAYQLSAKWKSQTLISQTKHSSIGYRVWNEIMQDSLNRNIRYSNSNYNSIEIQQNFTGDFELAGHRNRLVVGLDYYNARSNENFIIAYPFDRIALKGKDPAYTHISKAAVDAFLATLNPIRTISEQSTYSAYFSDVFNISHNFLAMASLRIDHFASGGSHDLAADTVTGKFSQTNLSPKLGLVYQLLPDKISVFGNYMNGFANNGTAIQPDGARTVFKPSNANQWEAGLKFNLLDGKLNSTISYYTIKVNDILRPDPTRNGFTIQDGGQISRGLETELIVNMVKGFNIIAGYAYNKAYSINTNVDIDGLRQWTGPAQTANLWLNYAFQAKALQGFSIGAGGNFNSKAYISQSRQFGEFHIPEYLVMNAVAGYDTKRFRISFKVDNLTNKLYWGSYVNQMMPRRFSANLAVKL